MPFIRLLLVAAALGVPCTHYANLIGEHPAAWWHGYDEFPDRVNWWYPGVATGDWSIPFGTELCITVTAIPEWAEEEYSHLVGREARGVVVDRMPQGWGQAIDTWPALARALMGPDWQRVGRVDVSYHVCGK